MEPRSLRCRVLLHPRVSSGSVGLAVQDATSVRGSLVPTFAYLYSSAVPSPPLLCLCSINQPAKQVDLDAFVPGLNVFSLSGCGSGCAVCLKRDQAVKFGFCIPIAFVKRENTFGKDNRKMLM